ncbi:hypothetical protein SELMODRAFT_414759 [Selaginella moellendorffii]|uniref:Uncharacterized protein n=1 Tax=Selaginella moellendorffii TaxID=88036 RepID=D8RTV2_SELML|nr:hypothetical protein SELMODRAFT_414759 [Selaginella moellendorffii]
MSWEISATEIFNEHIRKVPALGIRGEMTGQPLKLLFVFDEARSLLPSDDGREKNVYIPLRRSTRVLGGTCLTLLVDTRARVANFLGTEVVQSFCAELNCFEEVVKESPDGYKLLFKPLQTMLSGGFVDKVCYCGAWGVAFLVPIHLGDMKDRLNVSTLFIQAKDTNRSSGLIDLAENSPQFSGFRRVDESLYLSLSMNLSAGSGNVNKSGDGGTGACLECGYFM